MNGRRQSPVRHIYPALEIISAGSTGDVHTEDPLVRQALALIRSRPLDGLHPQELATGLGTSRRSLEQKFARSLGRGIAAVIRDEAISRAHRLVTETNIPLQDIAGLCGIATASHLATLFRKTYGQTMTEARQSTRSLL